MRMTKVTPQIKTHLTRVFEQYEQGKLTPEEKQGLFQDLYDSGLYLQMGPDVTLLITMALEKKIISPKVEPKNFN